MEDSPSSPLKSLSSISRCHDSRSNQLLPTASQPSATSGEFQSIPEVNEVAKIPPPVRQEDGSCVSSTHSFPRGTCGIATQVSNNEVPLVSDTSESQLQVPAHDFGFYEWDFREDNETPISINGTASETSHVPLRSAARSSTTSAMMEISDSLRGENSLCRASIEELMRPSIYKSQLSRELGPALAAELHSDMFGGITTESFTSRERTRSTGVTDPSIPIDEARQSPPPLCHAYEEGTCRRGRRLRHHTIDVILPLSEARANDIQFVSSQNDHPMTDNLRYSRRPARDVAFSDCDLAFSERLPRTQETGVSPVSKVHRRSRTADFHFDRGTATEASDLCRRQRDAEGDQGSRSFRKLLNRLSSSRKRKK